jgi:signal transduction histidine kinase
MEPRSLGETSTRRWRGDTAFPRWRVGTREKPMWVCFSVSDTGIGIAPEMMEVIFKPFTQVDNSSTREYGGTGLGLTISDHFCRAMGGAIVVESELGIGSTFTVQLPTRMG